MPVLYEGPSLINGKPIVAIATHASSNTKTGDMIQTWILPRDVSPVEAVKTGTDESVCGDCPHRHYNKGACYVLPFQGPRAVWEAYKRGVYSSEKHLQAFGRARGKKMVRLGAYGDPAAVPVNVWCDLLDDAPGWTGYTHQWRKAFAATLRTLCMASVDSRAEAELAAKHGWRYFRVLSPAEAEAVPTGARLNVANSVSVECLSDAKGRSCTDCGVCNGAKPLHKKQPTSVWIDVHGARSKAFKPKTMKVM